MVQSVAGARAEGHPVSVDVRVAPFYPTCPVSPASVSGWWPGGDAGGKRQGKSD